MATTKNLPILKIHTLTEVQYNIERDANRLEEDAFYLTPYEEVKVVSDLNSDSTTDALSAAAGKSLQDNKAEKSNVYTKLEINALLDGIEGGSSESADSVRRALDAYIQYTDAELYGAEKVEEWKATGTYNPQYSEATSRIDDHTHKYAGSSTIGGAANSVKASLAIKLNGGSTEGTDLFTFNGSTAKTINITPSTVGAAPASHASTAQDYGVASTSKYGHAKATGTTPKALGTTANIGTETTSFARGDHIHPLPSINDCTGTLNFDKALKALNPKYPSILGAAVPYFYSTQGNGSEIDSTDYVVTSEGAFYAAERYEAPQFGTLPLTCGGTGSTSVRGILETLGITAGFKYYGNVTDINNPDTTYIRISQGLATGSDYTRPEAGHLYAGIFYTNKLEQRPFIAFAQDLSTSSTGMLVNVGKYDIAFGFSSCTVHTAGASDTLMSLNATIILCKIF